MEGFKFNDLLKKLWDNNKYREGNSKKSKTEYTNVKIYSVTKVK